MKSSVNQSVNCVPSIVPIALRLANCGSVDTFVVPEISFSWRAARSGRRREPARRMH